jgi:hypothetical protein
MRVSAMVRYHRFVNWLEAEPWRWHYRAIYRSARDTLPPVRAAWAALTFPHVHHEDMIDMAYEVVDWLMSDDDELNGIPLQCRATVAGLIRARYRDD